MKTLSFFMSFWNDHAAKVWLPYEQQENGLHDSLVHVNSNKIYVFPLLFCLFVFFVFRENSFELSLNGRDFLVDDSVSLTGLGIVNGDLIYVVSNAQEQEGAQTSQTADCASSSNLNNVSQRDHLAQHAGSIAEVIFRSWACFPKNVES